MKKYTLINIILLILVQFLASCDYCGFMGENDLGNNFTLLEGDKIEEHNLIAKEKIIELKKTTTKNVKTI